MDWTCKWTEKDTKTKSETALSGGLALHVQETAQAAGTVRT